MTALQKEELFESKVSNEKKLVVERLVHFLWEKKAYFQVRTLSFGEDMYSQKDKFHYLRVKIDGTNTKRLG